MQRLADNLDTVKHTLDVVRPMVHDEDFDRFSDFTDIGQKFAGLSVAIKRDSNEHPDFLSATSETMPKLTELMLGVFTDPKRLRALADFGLISEAGIRNLGFLSFGGADIAGSQFRLARTRAHALGLNIVGFPGFWTAWSSLGYTAEG